MSEFTRGMFTALDRAASLANDAGKSRTATWLAACGDIAERHGPTASWPPAPAYKGLVVHIEDRTQQEIDLRALTADQLTHLGIALDAERFQRENG